MLDGVQAHLDAIANGETTANRIALIERSNSLDEMGKLWQGHFIKAFLWAAVLEPLCGTTVDLGNGIELRLNRRRKDIEEDELPGIRISGGDPKTGRPPEAFIEGEFLRNGAPLARWQGRSPLWPLIIRCPGSCGLLMGPGPYENFRPEVLFQLGDIARSWPAKAA